LHQALGAAEQAQTAGDLQDQGVGRIARDSRAELQQPLSDVVEGVLGELRVVVDQLERMCCGQSAGATSSGVNSLGAGTSCALDDVLAVAGGDALIFGIGTQTQQQAVQDQARAMNRSPLHD
jgi:hypothetical protein